MGRSTVRHATTERAIVVVSESPAFQLLLPAGAIDP
jgi:hypothetical protein